MPLKKYCWIYGHSAAMTEVTIGKNSVVDAHRFVNIDVLENFAVGVPARITGKLPVYDEPK